MDAVTQHLKPCSITIQPEPAEPIQSITRKDNLAGAAKNHWLRRALSFSLLPLTILLSNVVFAADIHVLATGALSAALKHLGPAFEQATGHRLVIAWGPSYGA